METENLAKLISERLVMQKSFLAPHQEYIEPLILNAIRDLNLVQADPVPEGAVPVVVYVGAVVSGDIMTASAIIVGDLFTDDEARDNAFDKCDTHRVRLEGYALPVSVPTVKAKAVMP